MYVRANALVACVLANAALLAGCVTEPQKTPAAVTIAGPAYPDNLHWYRDAAEQKAIYWETYRAAAETARGISKGLPARSWGVILDVDETILDNSEYQKRQALKGAPFEAPVWDAWINERAATALPGARVFIDTVTDELHGEVVLITNRTAAQCAATEDNLKKVGIRYDRILCDSVGDGNKNPRFHTVMEGDPGHPAVNVVLWVGDNIQDFPQLTQAQPGDMTLFGSHYFVLPNPVYGSWQKVPAR